MNSENTKSGDYAHKSAEWRTGAISGLWVGLTFIGLLAAPPAWAGPFSSFTDYAARMTDPSGANRQSTRNLRAEDQRSVHADRTSSFGSAERAAPHSISGARLILAPRQMASPSVRPGAAETSVLVTVNWSDAEGQTADSNPFAQVGNRSGLVSATRAEVRGSEVWLTDKSEVEVLENGGSNRRTAP
jgi:hypothetical protein